MKKRNPATRMYKAQINSESLSEFFDVKNATPSKCKFCGMNLTNQSRGKEKKVCMYCERIRNWKQKLI